LNSEQLTVKGYQFYSFNLVTESLMKISHSILIIPFSIVDEQAGYPEILVINQANN
jgi:hypothetical protein